MRVLIAAVGLLLLFGGVACGLIPAAATASVPASVISVARADTYMCGSPWAVDHDSIDREQGVSTLAATSATVLGTPTVADDTTVLCARAFGTRGVWGAVLAGLGALALLGVGLVIAARKRPAA